MISLAARARLPGSFGFAPVCACSAVGQHTCSKPGTSQQRAGGQGILRLSLSMENVHMCRHVFHIVP